MIHNDVDGPIQILRLNHGKASALDLELAEALVAELERFAKSAHRALVLTGTSAIFSAGVDLPRVLRDGPGYAIRFLPALDRALRALWACPKPTVAAVNGHAIAGGALLALACDWRIGSAGKASFGIPELKVGVPFPPLALAIARAALTPRDFDELVLTGRYLQGDEALARGCVHELAPQELVLPQALARARELAAVPEATYAFHKHELRRRPLQDLEREGTYLLERTLAAWSSVEAQAAMQGYVERTLRRKA